MRMRRRSGCPRKVMPNMSKVSRSSQSAPRHSGTPEADPPLARTNAVEDFEVALPVAILDGGTIHEVAVSLGRRIAQPREHLEQGVAAHIHDGVAARLERAADRAAEGRSEGVDGRIHAERNWWTELPNGSEISSIVSGGRRNPRSSSGCSSRRRTWSNSDSPLIFLWSSKIP